MTEYSIKLHHTPGFPPLTAASLSVHQCPECFALVVEDFLADHVRKMHGPVREWEAENHYSITGRGLVFGGREPDPPFEKNEMVLINGYKLGRVWGIERHPTADSPRPGRPVGVLLDVCRS